MSSQAFTRGRNLCFTTFALFILALLPDQLAAQRGGRDRGSSGGGSRGVAEVPRGVVEVIAVPRGVVEVIAVPRGVVEVPRGVVEVIAVPRGVAAALEAVLVSSSNAWTQMVMAAWIPVNRDAYAPC